MTSTGNWIRAKHLHSRRIWPTKRIKCLNPIVHRIIRKVNENKRQKQNKKIDVTNISGRNSKTACRYLGYNGVHSIRSLWLQGVHIKNSRVAFSVRVQPSLDCDDCAEDCRSITRSRYCTNTCRSFINVFTRRANGICILELNFFVRKTFL